MTDIDKQIESLGYEIRVSDLSCCYIVYENKKQDQEVIIEWEDDDTPVECCNKSKRLVRTYESNAYGANYSRGGDICC